LNKKIKNIYKKLFFSLGPQGWWPADGPFEVMVGAILTQNTNWKNVERAINNLKKKRLLNPLSLRHISQGRLARLIKPAGYFNIKAKRLKNFLDFLFNFYKGKVKDMLGVDTPILRRQLLNIKGIGPETADSILLYALGKPIFVVDAYTKRIFVRLGMIKEKDSYDEVQNFFMKRLKKNTKLFNEYHALLVRLGKEFCIKKTPRCHLCPLKELKCVNLAYF
jgi:endonuclease-3 related protein